MRFVFIQAHARIYRVRTMCRVLEVSRAGYYAWRARPLAERHRENAALAEAIRQRHVGYRRFYGSPRMRDELRDAGIPCSENRVARVMRMAGIRAQQTPAFRVTTQSMHREPIAANVLQRDFTVGHVRPDTVWMADITYVPTREGWLYLAVILDHATRRVVGWSLRTRLEQELACAAFRMAVTHRGAAPTLHHSDRGVQYASGAYRTLLQQRGVSASMSRKGDCWDNAVVESFFATLTKECLEERLFDSRTEAQLAIFEFIEVWYNRQRRHSSLGNRSPAAYEKSLAA